MPVRFLDFAVGMTPYTPGGGVAAPTNITAPTITGTLAVGQTLTASGDTWTGSPSGYNRRWLRDGSAISGASGSSYLLVTADAGAMISYGVIATNAGGSSVEVMATAVGPVGLAPTLISAGTISGTRGSGNTITHSGAAATGTPTPTIYRMWQTYAASVWSDTGVSTVGFTDNGTTETLPLRCVVTASNGVSPDAVGNTNQLSGAGVGVTLGDVTVSPATATVGVAYSGTVSGRTASSTLALTGTGVAGLSVNSTTGAITGTPTTAGAVNVVETLTGATNTPHTTNGVMTVAASGGLTNTRLPQLSGAAYGGQTLAYGRGGYSAGFTSRSHKFQYADTGAGPWTDVPDGAGDFLFLPVGTYTGKVISVLETVSDGTTTLNIRSAASPAVQAMAMAIPAPVSNPMMAVLGASFEGGIVRGASTDRYGWWVRPAMFGKFLMGNRRIRHNYSGTGIVPAQPYVLASDGDSAQQVAAQATTLAADSAYAAESAHFIWFNPGSNTLSASASGGTSWLTYAGNGLAALRAAYPNAQILIPEQMMRGTAGSEWIAGGFGRANVYQVNAALGALASTYGAIVVPWFARSGNPNDALEGRAYDWAVQDDLVHPGFGRGWEMGRGFAAAAKPYVADLGADASGTQVLTSVGAGSGGTLTNATGAVWANWTLEGSATQQVVGAVAGNKLTITGTVLADQAASGAFIKLRRSTGQFYATTANVAYRVRMKGRIRSTSPAGINAYLRAELTDNNSNLASAVTAGALFPGNQSGAYTISTTTSGAALISDDWQEFSLESSSFNQTTSKNVTPAFVVESRVAAGGFLAGQQIQIEFDEITVVSL